MDKPNEPKEELTKEELTVLIQVLNQPRNQDLQTAGALIQISNKISRMISNFK